MRYGVVLFSSDRGITPARAAAAAESAGFGCFYVPEHTHIPVRRDSPHPRTGTAVPSLIVLVTAAAMLSATHGSSVRRYRSSGSSAVPVRGCGESRRTGIWVCSGT